MSKSFLLASTTLTLFFGLINVAQGQGFRPLGGQCQISNEDGTFHLGRHWLHDDGYWYYDIDVYNALTGRGWEKCKGTKSA